MAELPVAKRQEREIGVRAQRYNRPYPLAPLPEFVQCCDECEERQRGHGHRVEVRFDATSSWRAQTTEIADCIDPFCPLCLHAVKGYAVWLVWLVMLLVLVRQSPSYSARPRGYGPVAFEA